MKHKKILQFGLVLVMFAIGVVLITYDGGTVKEFLAIIVFLATGVVAVKTRFGSLE